jgi:hypothetical protein
VVAFMWAIFSVRSVFPISLYGGVIDVTPTPELCLAPLLCIPTFKFTHILLHYFPLPPCSRGREFSP